MAYQPIVETRTGRTIAYEALMRTREPSMTGPAALLDAADRLHLHARLGRRVRERVAESFRPREEGALVFVNLHSKDLLDDDLYAPNAPLASIAESVVLELTERESLDEISNVRRRASDLRRGGYRLAVDDLGAGYAGLASFANLEPEIVKLDMSLIRDIDTSEVRGRIVHRMTDLCRDLGMKVVAEGIETTRELIRIREVGCDFAQGYLFGRPSQELTPGANL